MPIADDDQVAQLFVDKESLRNWYTYNLDPLDQKTRFTSHYYENKKYPRRDGLILVMHGSGKYFTLPEATSMKDSIELASAFIQGRMTYDEKIIPMIWRIIAG